MLTLQQHSQATPRTPILDVVESTVTEYNIVTAAPAQIGDDPNLSNALSWHWGEFEYQHLVVLKEFMRLDY